MEKPIFKQKQVALQIKEPGGEVRTENQRCLFLDAEPNIVITMARFGEFDVTHYPSGLRIMGGNQRLVHTQILLLHLVIFIIEKGIDASGTGEDLKKDFAKFADGRISGDANFKSWLALNRSNIGNEEFPWESSDDKDSPNQMCLALMEQLGALCVSQ